MPNSYPLIFKRRVISYYLQSGVKVKSVLSIFKISNGTLFNWMKQYENNMLSEKKRYNKIPKITYKIGRYIKTYVMRFKYFDYSRLISLIKSRYNVSISKTLLYSYLKKINITRKKARNRFIYKDKNKYETELKQFKKTIASKDKDKIISIDETSFDTNIRSEYGWSVKGKRLKINNFIKKRTRYTLISAISNKKVLCNMIIKGAADAHNFKNFIKQVHVKVQDGNLLMDNARIHHSKIVKTYIDNTCLKTLYNVAYTPELNPIEQMFSKLKYMVKKKRNNSTKLIENISVALTKITEKDIQWFYKNSFDF